MLRWLVVLLIISAPAAAAPPRSGLEGDRHANAGSHTSSYGIVAQTLPEDGDAVNLDFLLPSWSHGLTDRLQLTLGLGLPLLIALRYAMVRTDHTVVSLQTFGLGPVVPLEGMGAGAAIDQALDAHGRFILRAQLLAYSAWEGFGERQGLAFGGLGITAGLSENVALQVDALAAQAISADFAAELPFPVVPFGLRLFDEKVALHVALVFMPDIFGDDDAPDRLTLFAWLGAAYRFDP